MGLTPPLQWPNVSVSGDTVIEVMVGSTFTVAFVLALELVALLLASSEFAPSPMSPAMAVLCVAGVTKDAPHPSAAKLLVDFFVSDEGQKLFRDVDYIPAAPDVPPREPALRPDGKSFRGIFFSPEQADAAMPHWMDVYNEIFR